MKDESVMSWSSCFAYPFFFILHPCYSAERSHSGLVHRSRKPEWLYGHRGFESHPLRH